MLKVGSFRATGLIGKFFLTFSSRCCLVPVLRYHTQDQILVVLALEFTSSLSLHFFQPVLHVDSIKTSEVSEIGTLHGDVKQQHH